MRMAQSSQSKRGGRTSVLPGEKARTDRWPSANDDNLDRTSSRLGVKPSNPDGSEKALAARASALKRTITGISSASWPDPGPPPDGGRVAWTQAALLHLSTFNTFGYTTAFGVRAPYRIHPRC